MKKIGLVLLGLFVMIASYTVVVPGKEAQPTKMTALTTAKAATSTVSPSSVQIYVDGTKTDLDQSPVTVNGSTLVPLRSLFTKMGIKVAWDQENKEITVSNENAIIKMVPGATTATVNGKKVKLSATSLIENGTTYIPLRFIAESFDYIVGYDKGSRSISISTAPYRVGTVTYVVDGDTFDVEFSDKTKERIRLIGVNTPESTEAAGFEAGGKEASAFIKGIVLKQKVYVTKDTSNDIYGRTLAYVHMTSGEFINATLLSEGYGKTMAIAPNTKWKPYFDALQKSAQSNERQLWNPDLYGKLDKAEANAVLDTLSTAGINVNANSLSSPISIAETSSLLMYLLYPESRKLMLGYKAYEVITDESVKDIITQLSDKKFNENTEIVSNEQLRSLILLALGLKENSLITTSLDNLGLIPSLDRPLTLAEATESINKLAAFMPTIESLKTKSSLLETSLVTLEGWGTKATGSEAWTSISESLGNTFTIENLKSTAKGLSGWIKDSISGIFSKKPSQKEVDQLVESTEKTAKEYTSEIAEEAYRVFDKE